jgi:hypothetical protein
MVMDGRRKTKGAKWTELLTDVKRNGNERWTKWNKIRHNRTNEWMVITPAMTLQSDMRSRALRQWRVKEKKNVSLLLCVCFFFLFFFSSSKAATRATHYMTTSSKTHRSAQHRC